MVEIRGFRPFSRRSARLDSGRGKLNHPEPGKAVPRKLRLIPNVLVDSGEGWECSVRNQNVEIGGGRATCVAPPHLRRLAWFTPVSSERYRRILLRFAICAALAR